MARFEACEESPEVIAGGTGREWPSAWSSVPVRLVTMGVLVLTLAALGGYYVGTTRVPPQPPEVEHVTVLPLPGGRPSGAGFAFGSIWVTTWDGSVVRVDPRTRRVQDRISVGKQPLAVREGFGSVWVSNGLDGTVTRIDPEDDSVLATIPVGPVPYQLAAAGAGMWVATQEAAVKIDPSTNTVVKRTRFPMARGAATPSTAGVGLAADDRAVWVSTATGTVLRLRPDDGRLVATIRVLPDAHTSPGAVVLDGDDVWVSAWAIDGSLGPGAGEPRLGRTVGVVTIDATTNEIVERVSSAGYPVSGMLPERGRLYMVGGDYRNHESVLIRTDWPYRVLRSVRPVGGNSFDVVAADNALWVPSWDDHAMYVLPAARGGTR
ncbi:MAG: hypothetical protein HOQ22_14160 [Nocardioidaceae bacterium]|nr:hypothetical protein [Nocardioidaceae bacterium]NUS52169.1 hypothetical protein [Nocardioidaceae bacterium]